MSISRKFLLTITALSALLPSSDAFSADPVTVVLVHGAFENSAAWEKVIPILQKKGIRSIAVQNPLSSLSAAAEVTTRVIDDQSGSVLLVGHSWGGVVITEAGNNPKVKGLVYVTGASPDSGTSGMEEAAPYPRPALLSHLHTDARGYAYATEEGIKDLAQDLSQSERDLLLATQGPIALTAFSDKVGQAAWKSKPSWAIVANQDHAISPEEERDRAKKIGAKTTVINGSHSVTLSKPEEVAKVIEDAVASLK